MAALSPYRTVEVSPGHLRHQLDHATAARWPACARTRPHAGQHAAVAPAAAETGGAEMSHAIKTQQLCADIAAGTASAQDIEAARTRLDALELFVSMMGAGNLSEYQKDERRHLREALQGAPGEVAL